MTNILIVDCDSSIPNLACCSLYRFWNTPGNKVTFMRLGINVYGKRKEHIVDCTGYDLAFVSAIFDTTPSQITIINGDCKVDCGGTGYDIKKKLPAEIEQCKPDYSIYPDNDTSYGFISRGCIRSCEFCIVREKEGDIHQVAQPHDIIHHHKVKFLDNNFLALPNHIEILTDMIEMQETKMQFNQGLDMRLITDENAELLSKLNYMGEYIFAFDSLATQSIIERNLAIFKKYVPKNWRIKFFIYCCPKMDIVSDVYARILWCKENKVLPYFMRDSACWQSENVRTYNDFSAWCNQPGIFKGHTYKEFCLKRRPQSGRTDVFPEWFIKMGGVD